VCDRHVALRYKDGRVTAIPVLQLPLSKLPGDSMICDSLSRATDSGAASALNSWATDDFHSKNWSSLPVKAAKSSKYGNAPPSAHSNCQFGLPLTTLRPL
jgi:hypothetical protein